MNKKLAIGLGITIVVVGGGILIYSISQNKNKSGEGVSGISTGGKTIGVTTLNQLKDKPSVRYIGLVSSEREKLSGISSNSRVVLSRTGGYDGEYSINKSAFKNGFWYDKNGNIGAIALNGLPDLSSFSPRANNANILTKTISASATIL